ncbi:LacI family DNA-binding transcriptional regulator [Candidatus Sumerlaeota bacterium]|nr:LacI family DNA-binding transcriptional regulator [Candidatus Sumerlaeota bacterium]
MGKKVNIVDIAREANVNYSTVSLALNNSPKVSCETGKRIRELACKMGYQPNYMARALKGQKSFMVGIQMPTLRDPFFIDMLVAIESELSERKHSCLLSVSGWSADEEKASLDEMINRAADGLIIGYDILTTGLAKKKYNEIASLNKPIALYTECNCLDYYLDVDVDLVRCDLTDACYRMTRYLIELGHTRIAFILPETANTKRAGYRKALKEHGISLDPALEVELPRPHIGFPKLTDQILEMRPRPTAIFAYNDQSAVEVLRRLQERGIRTPEEISVVGINNNLVGQMEKIKITTMSLHADVIGKTLVEMFFQRQFKPDIPRQHKSINAQLIPRDSTAPCPAQSKDCAAQ